MGIQRLRNVALSSAFARLLAERARGIEGIGEGVGLVSGATRALVAEWVLVASRAVVALNVGAGLVERTGLVEGSGLVE